MQWKATTVWVGEGAYVGHIAFTEQSFQDCSWDVSGVIIEGDLPPVVEAIPPR